MNIKSVIANARERLHIEQLTPMQHKMAGIAESASAVALIAPTGSGKTLAFALPLLARIGDPDGKTRGLVIAPSRELVLQITKVISALAPSMRVTALYGGHSVLDESRSLGAAVPDVIVGTPGRILDHLNRGRIDLFNVRVFVADEYDKTLELGFHDEMRRILRNLKRRKLTVLTSATPLRQLPDWMGIDKLETIDFTAGSGETDMPRLSKATVASPEPDKLETLRQLLLGLAPERTLVFVNHRESAERVHAFLRKAGLPSVLYHGAIDQQERENAVDLLANGTTPIMVATDLAARGLDIPQVQSVIHYHMPSSAETLTHRNGRAARMGAEGNVYYILAPDETCPDADNPAPCVIGEPHSWPRKLATLYFHSGRKEKLSKADIVGALTGPGNLAGTEIGLINLHDHRALAAVPAQKLDRILSDLSAARIKGRRIRVSALR